MWVTILLHLVCFVLADSEVPGLTELCLQECLAHRLRFDSRQLNDSARFNRCLPLCLRVFPEHLHYGSRFTFVLLIESVQFLPCLEVFATQTKQRFEVLIYRLAFLFFQMGVKRGRIRQDVMRLLFVQLALVESPKVDV